MITSSKTYTPEGLMLEGTLALARAEQYGIRVDVDYCKRTTEKLNEEIEQHQEVFDKSDLAAAWKKKYRRDTNFDSNVQLASVLYGVLGHTAAKQTESGAGAVDGASLMSLNIPEVTGMLKVKRLTKIRETYIGAFLREQVDGIMHPSFDLNKVVSFRSSSSSPNFQNIPNRDYELKQLCRNAIYPRYGNKLLMGDFKGAEVCGAACYHKDPTMIEYLCDFSKDMHRDVATECFLLMESEVVKPIRNTAKSFFTFAQFYGDWYKSCAENMWREAQTDSHVLRSGVTLIDHLKKKRVRCYEDFERVVQKVEDRFWNVRFPVYKQWKEDWWEEYVKKGYFITLTGFKCSGVMDTKQAINYPIQGTSFHLLLMALVLLDRAIIKNGLVSRIIAQIHDEIVIDLYPPEEEFIVSELYKIVRKKLPYIFPWINVPLVIELECTGIDEPWSKKQPLEVSYV